MKDKQETLLDINEASQILGVCTKTLSNYTKKGIVPCVRHGKFLRFQRDYIEKMKATGWSLK